MVHLRPRPLMLAATILLLTASGAWLRIEQVRRSPERTPEKLAFDAWFYYVSAAESLLAGHGLDPAYNHRQPPPPLLVPPPLQSLFVAAVYKLRGAHDLMTLYGVQVALSIAAGLLLMLILWQWGGWPEALAGLAGWMFYPEFGVWVGTALSESNYFFWMLLSLFCIARWAGTQKTAWAVAAAVGIGLGNLQRPTALLMGVFLAPLAAWRVRDHRRWLHALIFLALPPAVLLPWMARNLIVTGDPVWVSSNGGILFYAVNHPGFDPVAYPDYGTYPDSLWVVPKIQERIHGPEFEGRRTYYQLSRLYFAEARRYMLRQPLHFLKNNAIKAFQRFTRVPRGIGDFYPWLPPWVSRLMFFVLLAAGLIGLAGGRAAWRHPVHQALACCFACTTLFLTVMHHLPSGRLALPLRVYLLLFGAMAVGGTLRRLDRRPNP